jgi:hypothetical protein
MYWLYLLPYAVLTSFAGVLGGVLAVAIVVFGTLRILFLAVLLMTLDFARLKSEYKEGWNVIVDKFRALREMLRKVVAQ